jgi:hypothetical protein
MDRGLLVTGYAFGGDAAKLLVGMTAFTLDLGMLAFQGEKVGVIESVHTIFAIVAGDAGGSVLRLVLLHERWFIVRMAGDAVLRVEWLVGRGLQLARMAAGAVDRLALLVFNVQRQAETGVGMVESLVRKAGGFPGYTGVAG